MSATSPVIRTGRLGCLPKQTMDSGSSQGRLDTVMEHPPRVAHESHVTDDLKSAMSHELVTKGRVPVREDGVRVRPRSTGSGSALSAVSHPSYRSSLIRWLSGTG